MPTPPSQYRFGPETLALIEQLRSHFGLTSGADVLRLAVSRLAKSENVAPKPVGESRKKSEKSA